MILCVNIRILSQMAERNEPGGITQVCNLNTVRDLNTLLQELAFK